MNDKLRGGLIAAAAIAALGGGAAIASGSGSSNPSAAPTAERGQSKAADEGGATDESQGRDDGAGQPVTGSPLDRASAVALQEVGGGKVTGSEIRDEEGFYEIEVTSDDGSQIDVHLDQNYNVIDASGDGGG